jgi:hypothetical protein
MKVEKRRRVLLTLKGRTTLYEVGMTLKGEIGYNSRGLELRVG